MEDAHQESNKTKEPEEKWLDITAWLARTTKEMEDGQMLMRKDFGLFESMSATEIMDPKMDSGMNCDGVYTLDEQIQLGILPLDETFTVPQIIGVMDNLLAAEMTWWSGFTLAHTLFTCIYLHRVSILKNPYLSVYCKTLLKTCELIRGVVMRGDIYEEEDFIAHTFGFGFCEEISDAQLGTFLKEVEEDLQAKQRRVKGKKTTDDIKPLQDDESKEEQYVEALLARIRFRRALHATQLNLDKGVKGIELAKKSITYTSSQLAIIKNTVSLGTLPDKIFDPNIGRRLQGPTPSRTVPLLSIETAIKNLEDHLSKVELVLSIANLTKHSEFEEFFFSFNAMEPDIVARSRLQALFIVQKKVFGKTEFLTIVKESMTSFGIPSELVNSDMITPFAEKVATVTLQTFKLLGFNRARRRRRLVHLMEDFLVLQQDAAELDEQIAQKNPNSASIPPEQRPQYFGSWVMDKQVVYMFHYLSLGFELELYNPPEYPMIFWYMDYLCGVQLQNLLYIQNMTAASKISAKPKKKNKSLKKRDKELAPTPLQYQAEAHHSLCRGISRFLFALNRYTNQSPPKYPFGDDVLRFYHSALHKVDQPPPLHYNHYIETTDFSGLSQEQLFNGAIESFKQSKACIEKLLHASPPPPQRIVDQLKTLARVAVSNLVQLQLITNMLNKHPKTAKVQYDFTVHKYYPVVSLK